MHFKAIATDQAGFDGWIEQARAGGGNLDRNRYLELETPSENVRPVHCAEVNPLLFARIVNMCVEPGRRRNSDRTRAWPPFLQTTPPFCWAG